MSGKQSPYPGIRLAILASHPIQYSAPLYRRIVAEEGIELTVFYCSRQGSEEYFDAGFGQQIRWDVPLLEDYRSKFLPNLRRSGTVGGFTSLVNPSIISELRHGHFDALWLHGHSHATDLMAYTAAKALRIPILYHSESSLYYDRVARRSARVRIVKPVALRLPFSGVSRFLAIGSRNRAFYMHYGASPRQIFYVPYSVDNEHFSKKADDFRSSRDAIRNSLGIDPAEVVFLWAAKMTPQKAPLEMLEAFSHIRDVPGASLLMVGDGELRGQAEAFVREARLQNVHFTGVVNQSEMPKYYAISDVLVRPDGVYQGDWGLTINEAMAAGLAVVTTNAIGATDDLVQHGENGFAVRFGDAQSLAAALRRLATDPRSCRRMGVRSAEVIRTWSYRECVQGVLGALHSLPRSRAEPCEVIFR